MELENIVANTVYIKARAGEGGKHKGRSKKWKQMLKLPHITECLDIKDELPLNKDFLIDNQPIGKKLFRQFCAQNPVYDNIFQVIEEVVSTKWPFSKNNTSLNKNNFFIYFLGAI